MAAEYCFKCTKCGGKEVWSWPDTDFHCETGRCARGSMVRDYKAESVSIDKSSLR